MNAASELAQLLPRGVELALDVGQQFPGTPVADLRRERLDPGRHGGEPLLGAFAELLLEPPPLGVGGLDDPPPRGRELLGAGEHLGLQAHVRDRQSRRRRHRLDKLRVLEHRAVVDEHGDALAVGVDRGDRALSARRGERDRPAGLVGVAVAEPVAELERGVAERPRQPVAQRDRLPQLAEVDDETRHRAL